MARKPRIHYDGALYHVMLRGNAGNKIFFDDKDFIVFENLLGDGVKRFEHRIMAYCCMSNHVHLLIQVGDIPLSKIIQNVSFRYTKYINKKQKRIGHLFQGRYKAIVVDIENYLLELIRYIHLNPIRARIERKLGNYKWNSHLSYVGKRNIEWLDYKFVLSHFSKRKSPAINKYLEFLNAESNLYTNKLITSYISGQDGGILGDDVFIKGVEKRSHIGADKAEHTLSKIISQFCKYKKIRKREIIVKAKYTGNLENRNFLIYLCIEHSSCNLQEIAKEFDLSPSAVSKIRHLFKKKLSKSNVFKRELLQIKELFV